MGSREGTQCKETEKTKKQIRLTSFVNLGFEAAIHAGYVVLETGVI